MKIKIGNSSDIISKAQAIRHQVFVIEQDIPQELDLDGLDNISHHALVTDGNSLVATARLCINESNSSVMARVAVIKKFRGSGIASKVVRSLISHAYQQGATSIIIHAHMHLKNYYEKFGFKFICNAEKVGEHQLIEMKHQMADTDHKLMNDL